MMRPSVDQSECNGCGSCFHERSQRQKQDLSQSITIFQATSLGFEWQTNRDM